MRATGVNVTSNESDVGTSKTAVNIPDRPPQEHVRHLISSGELPVYLDQKQACELLGIGRTKFFYLVREGKMPGAFRLGKAIRVNTASLLAGLAKD